MISGPPNWIVLDLVSRARGDPYPIWEVLLKKTEKCLFVYDFQTSKSEAQIWPPEQGGTLTRFGAFCF